MRRFLFGLLWFVIIFHYCSFVGSWTYGLVAMAQAPASAISSEVSYNAGLQFGLKYTGHVLLLALIVSIVGSMLGILPGTKLKRSNKKTSRLAAGSFFFGLFFVVPVFGVMMGAIATLLGIMGLVNIAKNSDKLTGKFWAILGILLGIAAFILRSIFFPYL